MLEGLALIAGTITLVGAIAGTIGLIYGDPKEAATAALVAAGAAAALAGVLVAFALLLAGVVGVLNA